VRLGAFLRAFLPPIVRGHMGCFSCGGVDKSQTAVGIVSEGARNARSDVLAAGMIIHSRNAARPDGLDVAFLLGLGVGGIVCGIV